MPPDAPAPAPATPPAVTPPAATPAVAPATALTPPPAAATPPAQPAVTPPVGTGSASEYAEGDWRRGLPPELQSEPSLKVMNDIPAMAKAYISAQKLVGADKIVMPSKHATPEEIHAFHVKLGLPETIDKYAVEIPKDAKYIDSKQIDELKPLAFKAGIKPQQLEALVNWYEENSGKQMEAMQNQKMVGITKGIEDLKAEWGAGYGNNLTRAQRVLKEFGAEGLNEHLIKTQIGNDPMIIRTLAKIGEHLYKEDGVVGGGGVAGTGLDPKTAKARADSIRNDLKHPYHLAGHPNHDAAVREVQDLMAQAYY